jgi:hypothetical protein
MTQEFKSALTRGGNAITPERLVITDSTVQWSQNNGMRSLFLAKKTITIPRGAIVGVEVDGKLIGSNIFIWTYSGQQIMAQNFTSSDAKTIKKILQKKFI